MTKWLICKLWGHKTITKAYTGETFLTESAFRGFEMGLVYNWKQHPYCLRCGTPNKKVD